MRKTKMEHLMTLNPTLFKDGELILSEDEQNLPQERSHIKTMQFNDDDAEVGELDSIGMQAAILNLLAVTTVVTTSTVNLLSLDDPEQKKQPEEQKSEEDEEEQAAKTASNPQRNKLKFGTVSRQRKSKGRQSAGRKRRR